MGVNHRTLCLSQGNSPQIVHKLRGQADGIAHLTWSPDDSLLLSCGREDSPEAIVFSTQVSTSWPAWMYLMPYFSLQTGEVKCRVQNSAEDSLTCGAWSPDGQHFYVGGTRGQFLECVSLSTCCRTLSVRHQPCTSPLPVQGIDGSVSSSWEGIRVSALAAHSSPHNVYAADTHCRIRHYNFNDMTYHTL